MLRCNTPQIDLNCEIIVICIKLAFQRKVFSRYRSYAFFVHCDVFCLDKNLLIEWIFTIYHKNWHVPQCLAEWNHKSSLLEKKHALRSFLNETIPWYLLLLCPPLACYNCQRESIHKFRVNIFSIVSTSEHYRMHLHTPTIDVLVMCALEWFAVSKIQHKKRCKMLRKNKK